ncbi:MAG: hypothetical protein ACPHL6_09325, partial [Rubripirellula sp.]
MKKHQLYESVSLRDCVKSMRIIFPLRSCFVLVFLIGCHSPWLGEVRSQSIHDVVVYGGTSAGVLSAVQV